MVLIDKLNKRKVYRYLLNEGVIVIKKEFTTTPHKDTEVPNLHVWMLLRSLKDRDYVELIFSWQYYYYFLKNEGKKYLCEFLGLNEEVQPLTWKYL
jgi:small subunit ribosomal protein S10e